MENLKVSIIIPVYKVEKYLKQCVDSVLRQSYGNLEIILVDDGSPDTCPDICDEYQMQDERIVVIHKANGGAAETRNVGLKTATGHYVMFMDADDFLTEDIAIECLISRIEKSKADVLNFAYKKYYELHEKCTSPFNTLQTMPSEFKSREEQLNYITQNGVYIAAVWNKVIKKDILTEYMQFEVGNLSEDIEWCARLLMHARTMDFLCEDFYCYRLRDGSTTYTLSEKNCRALAYSIEKCVEISNTASSRERIYLYRYIAYQLSTFIMVQALTDTCPKVYVKKLAKLKWLLKYHCKNKKVICLYYATKIIGFKTLCKIVRIIQRVRR